MLETVCEYAKGERLDLRPRLVGRRAISQNAREIPDLGNPTTVRFPFQVDLERHSDLIFYKHSALELRRLTLRLRRTVFRGASSRLFGLPDSKHLVPAALELIGDTNDIDPVSRIFEIIDHCRDVRRRRRA